MSNADMKKRLNSRFHAAEAANRGVRRGAAALALSAALLAAGAVDVTTFRQLKDALVTLPDGTVISLQNNVSSADMLTVGADNLTIRGGGTRFRATG